MKEIFCQNDFSWRNIYFLLLQNILAIRYSFQYQWRRQDFFRGGRPSHLKAIMRTPAGGPRVKAPRTVAKFHFLKRFKVLENESSFQKYRHFSLPKNLFFLRKISKNWTYFTRISEVFLKNYFKNFTFYDTYKSREIRFEFYYLIENFMNKAKKIA